MLFVEKHNLTARHLHNTDPVSRTCVYSAVPCSRSLRVRFVERLLIVHNFRVQKSTQHGYWEKLPAGQRLNLPYDLQHAWR
jgi:hypothetical protein